MYHSTAMKVSDGSFRPLFKTPRIDWCALMADGKASNFLVRDFFLGLKENYPGLLHKCPYQGRLELSSGNAHKKFMKMFGSSVLRSVLKIVDDVRKVTAEIVLITQVSN